ncbi:MAG: hypothetical protein ACYSUN_14965 [Planctomycetota bacterium]|jgi:hypothetical protein
MIRNALILPALLLVLALLPACSGNLADLFAAFPTSAFEDGDGTIPDDGGQPTPGPGQFVPTEVGFLESSQGVTGDVRNVVTAQVGATLYAFAAAGTDGVHVVDVTEPERINTTNLLITLSDAVLTDPVKIEGGRVDTLTVMDNAYLVCVAVGSDTENAVTVFHIATLIDRAMTSPSDLSDAHVPRSDAEIIVVPGTADGKAGGVSGSTSFFFVATGGPELGTGFITPGTPGTWRALPPFTSDATPQIDQFLDVRVKGFTLYASVRTGDTWGIVAAGLTGNPPTAAATTQDILEVPSTGLSVLADSSVAGPGNYPLDLAVEESTLFVTGDDAVEIFNITNPATPSIGAPVTGTGSDTIAVAASSSFFAVGAGDNVSVYSTLVSPPVRAARVELTASLTVIRGVAMLSSASGRFVVCCAGERGLRFVQWSNIP